MPTSTIKPTAFCSASNSYLLYIEVLIMLRTTISSIGARGAARATVPMLRSSFTNATPLRSLAQRSFSSTPTRSIPKPSTNFTFSSNSYTRASTNSPQSILQRLRHSVRFFTSSRTRLNGKPASPKVTPELGSPGGPLPEPTTLKGKLKKLSREYGWTVVGVYFALSVLDFPFCFLLVRTVGTDRVGM